MNCMTEFKSQHGWSIDLPPRWEALDPASPDAMETARNVVFGYADDWSASLTWMQPAKPVDVKVTSRFLAMTALNGRLPIDEIPDLLSTVFPVIGDVVEASAITLPDGRQALEVIESYKQGEESKKGYQLILTVNTRHSQAPTFQRLCFYAPDQQFDQLIASVQKACQSFRQS